jgi:ribosomal protein S18 acetylase RimI-like enzyme
MACEGAISLRSASDCDADAILSILELALEADPFVRWLARGKPRAVRAYLVLMLERIALPKGLVRVALVDGEIAASALWAPPRTFELGATESLRLLPTMMSVIGPWRFSKVASILDEVERARPPEPRWLLTLLGTHPDRRGLGLASALLTETLRSCDERVEVAVCETSAEQNLAFYARHGFEAISERRLGADGPQSWTLRRAPRAPLG